MSKNIKQHEFFFLLNLIYLHSSFKLFAVSAVRSFQLSNIAYFLKPKPEINFVLRSINIYLLMVLYS